MKIVLHIDRLVLDRDWPSAEAGTGDRVLRALREELQHCLADPGAAQALRALGTMDALPRLQLDATGGDSASLGAALARTLGNGLLAHADAASRRAHSGADTMRPAAAAATPTGAALCLPQVVDRAVSSDGAGT